MTPQDVIIEARQILQDVRGKTRYSDDVMVTSVNQAIRRMLLARPDLFSEYGEIPTQSNVAIQSLPSGSIRLIEIYQVKDGDSVTEVDRQTLDRGTPNWMSQRAGVPRNYIRHKRNPNKFFLYPRPTPNIVLMGEYAKTPEKFGFTDSIDVLPDGYSPVLVDGVVFICSSIDDQHVNSGRVDMFYKKFMSGLGVGIKSRPLTDQEDGGGDSVTVGAEGG